MSKFVLVDITTKGPIKTDLSYISGSTIRGTYINTYINKNHIKEDISLNKEYRRKLLSNSIRFFDAYPKVDGNYSIPTPLCFYATKDKIKEFSRDKKPIEVINEFTKDVGEGYQRVNKSEFSLIKDNALNLISIKKVENLHNCKQIDSENIFRYEAIDKNQKFYTIIQCDDDLADEVKDCIDNHVLYIGGSKSSGYGRCEIEVEGIFDYKDIKEKYGIGLNEKTKTLNVFFQSDAIIRDEYGNLKSSVPKELLENKLGIKIKKLDKSSIISKDVKGYNAMWKCKVPSVTAIKAGSVITYEYEGSLDQSKIEQLEIEGIGARKNEGYGRILINPKFDVNECAVYEPQATSREKVELSDNSRALMQSMLKNIIAEREKDYLTGIIVESLDGYAEETKKRKIKLKDFPNSQKGKFINEIVKALNLLNKEGEEASKAEIIKFRDSLKTRTKHIYENRSKYNLFDLSIKDYLTEIISEKSLEEITETKLDIKYPDVEGIDCYKSSDYEMKLKLSKRIMEYKIREKDKGGNK